MLRIFCILKDKIKVMKSLFLLLGLFFGLSFSSSAQTGYSIIPESFDVSFNEYLSNVNNLILRAEMANSSDNSFGFNWEIRNINIPAEWELAVSDKLFDYVPGITNNQMPLELEEGDIAVPYNIHLYPNNKMGCGTWEVLITLESDPSIIIDTIEYDITVNDDDCMLSGTQDLEQLLKLNVFPNPYTTEINITADLKIRKITILDIQGKIVFTESGSQISRINPILDSGMYMMQIEFTDRSFKSYRRVIKL